MGNIPSAPLPDVKLIPQKVALECTSPRFVTISPITLVIKPGSTFSRKQFVVKDASDTIVFSTATQSLGNRHTIYDINDDPICNMKYSSYNHDYDLFIGAGTEKRIAEILNRKSQQVNFEVEFVNYTTDSLARLSVLGDRYTGAFIMLHTGEKRATVLSLS